MAIITNLQPPAGAPIAPDTALSFDVIDPVIAELRVFVWVVFRDTGQVELAYDAINFQANYSFSEIVTIPGGRRFILRRVGGWPNTPELRVDDCACPPELVPPSTGEVNTASNQGGGAGQLFIAKVAEDLQFRTLESTDGSIAIVTGADTVDLTFAGSAGGRPVTNSSPVITAPAIGQLAYSPPADEIFQFSDTGGGETLEVTLPAISTLAPGQVIGIELLAGNSTNDIAFLTDPTDDIIDPLTGAPPLGPALFYAAGTFSAGALIVWEGVAGAITPTWAPRYDRSTLGSGGGGGDWATVLAAGNESGGTDARMTDEDRIEWNPDVALGPVMRGWKTARRASLPGTISGNVPVGGALVSVGGFGGDLLDVGNQLTLRIQAAIRTFGPGPGTVTQDYAVIERVYAPTSVGGLAVVRTITYENPGDWLSVVNNSGDIFLEAPDGDDPAEVYAMIEVLASPGRNFV